MIRIGLDLHGVIDAYPKFFSELSKIIKNDGQELHVITGSRDDKLLREELAQYGIVYSNIFSITDYHIDKGTPIQRLDEKGNYWFVNHLWNKTKAEYCFDNGIDFQIDDSEVYGDYFNSPYCYFDRIMCSFEWTWEHSWGNFLMLDPESTYKQILKVFKNIREDN